MTLQEDEVESTQKGEKEVRTLSALMSGRREWLLFVVSLLLLVVLGYTVREVFSPIIVYVIFLVATYPMRHETIVRHLILLATLLFGIWFIVEVAGAVLPFVVAFLISFIFSPVVEMLAGKKIPRSISIIGILLTLFGALIALTVVLLPMVFQQFQNFLTSIPTLTSEVSNSLNSLINRGFLGFSPENQNLQQAVIAEISSRIEDVTRAIPNGILNFVAQSASALTKMLNLVLVPFLSFYILKDFELIKYRVKMLFPRRYRQRASEIYTIVDRILGSYLRGALTVAFINSIVISSLMSIWGVKYPLVIGLISGLLDMIPYFGIIVSMSVAVLIALFGDSPGFQVAMVVVSFLGMNLTETTILYPRIIGSKIGVHPVLLILALLVFGYFMGFLGLLVAVPTTAILIALRKYYERNLRPAH
ncbi:MAG: AI-2E family transporter [Bacteroidetes bacterium]|jgi:predicted PurR-regulated permease PerM|nr:AI-2E family transporter [Bacteroidota bacterium]MCL5034064.1 AI-2E family transporter [Bacteroidota bacterium]